MIHTFRIERLCIGHSGWEDEFFQTEKEVNRAFANLGMVIEQLLTSGPMSASRVSTLFTIDGLDVRAESPRDAVTIRNLVASVVSDVNVAHPGLNLSLITRTTLGGNSAQRPSPLLVEVAEDSVSPISVDEDEQAPLAFVVAASLKSMESEPLRVAA